MGMGWMFEKFLFEFFEFSNFSNSMSLRSLKKGVKKIIFNRLYIVYKPYPSTPTRSHSMTYTVTEAKMDKAIVRFNGPAEPPLDMLSFVVSGYVEPVRLSHDLTMFVNRDAHKMRKKGFGVNKEASEIAGRPVFGRVALWHKVSTGWTCKDCGTVSPENSYDCCKCACPFFHTVAAYVLGWQETPDDKKRRVGAIDHAMVNISPRMIIKLQAKGAKGFTKRVNCMALKTAKETEKGGDLLAIQTDKGTLEIETTFARTFVHDGVVLNTFYDIKRIAFDGTEYECACVEVVEA